MSGKYSMLLFLSVLFVHSCSLFETTTPQLIDFLPRETEVPGWIIKGKTVAHSNKEITSIKNVYALFGAVDYASEKYNAVSDNATIVEVELMKLPSAFHSFGLFSFERGFGDERKDATDENYFSDTGMYIWKGEYYIKISALPGKIINRKDLEVFGAIISANLEQIYSRVKLPDYVYTFSEKFSTRDLVYYINGHRLLPESSHFFVRKKLVFDSVRYLYFMKMESTYDSETLYYRMLNSGDPKFTLTKSENIQMGFKKGDGERYVFISQYRDFIFGVLNAEDINNGTRIIAKLHKDLAGFYK